MVSAIASSRPARLARLLHRVAGVAGAGIAVALAAPASADPADKATAEALFEHARSLMKEGHYAEACPKLAESQRLDAGVGTMLYLADCYEHDGQTASAWATFLDAAGVAHAAGQAEREKKAREHAAALEGKLNRVSVSLAAGAEAPGIEVKRDGKPLDKVVWGTAVPLDPGEHTVEATAPGKLPWSVKVQISAADTATRFVVVPMLTDAPASEAAKPPAIAPPPPSEPPKVEAAPPAPPPPRAVPRRAPLPLPPEEAPHTSSARAAGYSMLGVGLAGGAVGGILGAVALEDKSNSASGCRANNVCLPGAASERNNAVTIATASTASLIVGGALFVIGVVILVATRPAESLDKQVARLLTDGDALRHPRAGWLPRVGVGPGGASFGGAF